MHRRKCRRIWYDGTDLGSIEDTGSNDNKKNFQLLAEDLSKLPTDKYVAPGSSAFVLDTSDVYVFHGESKTWMPL